MNNTNELSAKQEQAILALIDTGGVIAEAAARVRVNESTLWRWLQEPKFRSAYRGRRSLVVEGAIAQLQNNCVSATQVLRDVMMDETVPASARITAAKSVIEFAINAVTMTDLLERVEELERIAKGNESSSVKMLRGLN